MPHFNAAETAAALRERIGKKKLGDVLDEDAAANAAHRGGRLGAAGNAGAALRAGGESELIFSPPPFVGRSEHASNASVLRVGGGG